jgi:hypothetical protein
MHKFDYTVRADDFRNAWPIAYQLCMTEVAGALRQADALILNCKNLTQDTQRLSETTAGYLRQVAVSSAAKIKAAGDANADLMRSGVDNLLETAKSFVSEERAMRALTQKKVDKLAVDQKQFDKLRNRFRDMTLWQRLRVAIRPAGVFL